MNEIELHERKLDIESSSIKFNGYGFDFEGKPTIEEWYKAFQKVKAFDGILQFCLGDLIVYAESPVTGWGESKYSDLMNETGYAYDTLSRFAQVARRFNVDFRKEILKHTDTYPNVSFNHFQLVQSLEDAPAKHFLEMVRDGGWSVAKLREEVQRFKNGGRLPEPRERAPLELPEGWMPLRDAPKDMGYVPAPERLDPEDDSPRVYLVLEAWELERLMQDYEDDPTMVSLVSRIEVALDGIR